VLFLHFNINLQILNLSINLKESSMKKYQSQKHIKLVMLWDQALLWMSLKQGQMWVG